MGKPSLVWTQLQASKQAGRLGGASKMCTLSIDSVHSSTRASTGVHQPPPRPPCPPCTPLARSPPRGRARGEAVVRHVMLGHLEPLQRSQADLSPQRRLGVVRTSLRRHPVLPPSAPGDGSLGEGGGEGGREEGGKRREEREQEEKENKDKKRGRKGKDERKRKKGDEEEEEEPLPFLLKSLSQQDASLDFFPPHARHLAAAADRTSPLFS